MRERGAYAQNKNTAAQLSAKNAGVGGGGAYARGGAYLRDTTDTECKPKNKNEGGLGTRLNIHSTHNLQQGGCKLYSVLSIHLEHRNHSILQNC